MVGLERRRCKLLTQFKMIGNDSVCSIWKRMLFLVIVSAFGTQYASQFVRQFNAPSLSSICFSIRASIYVNVSISVYNLLPSHFSFQPTYVFRILNMKEFCFYCKTVQPPILPTPNRPPDRPSDRPNDRPTDRPTVPNLGSHKLFSGRVAIFNFASNISRFRVEDIKGKQT